MGNSLHGLKFDKNGICVVAAPRVQLVWRTASSDRFIIVELTKFNRQVTEIETDLEKLVYTMKTLHTTEPTQYPAFWNEEWLKRAIDELDTRKMTPEERAYFARVTAANAEAVKAERQRIEEVKTQEKEKFVISLLQQTDFDEAKISSIASVSVEFVKNAQRKLIDNK